jgi:hypothetical protein
VRHAVQVGAVLDRFDVVGPQLLDPLLEGALVGREAAAVGAGQLVLDVQPWKGAPSGYRSIRTPQRDIIKNSVATFSSLEASTSG